MSTEVLNQVSKVLVAFANAKGIDLSKSFKTPDEFKQFVIALCVKTLVDAGLSPVDAMGKVLGMDIKKEVDDFWEKSQSK